jgi:hypothetical protein
MKHLPEHEQLRGRDDRHLAALTRLPHGIRDAGQQ